MKLSITREQELSTEGKLALLDYLIGNLRLREGSEHNPKISIIKAIRASEGWGLKETKDLIDAAEFHTSQNMKSLRYIHTPVEDDPIISLGDLLRSKLDKGIQYDN